MANYEFAAFTRRLDAPAAYKRLSGFSEKFGFLLFFLEERGGVFNVASAGAVIRAIRTLHSRITKDRLLIPAKTRTLQNKRSEAPRANSIQTMLRHQRRMADLCSKPGKAQKRNALNAHPPILFESQIKDTEAWLETCRQRTRCRHAFRCCRP